MFKSVIGLVLCTLVLTGFTTDNDDVSGKKGSERKKEVVENAFDKDDPQDDPQDDIEDILEEISSDFCKITLLNRDDNGNGTEIRIDNYNNDYVPHVTYKIDSELILDKVEISSDDFITIFNKMDEFEPVVRKDKADYWPHTSEYPAMLVLFEFETDRPGKTYAYDSALCKPENYDEFVKEIQEIIEKYAEEG